MKKSLIFLAAIAALFGCNKAQGPEIGQNVNNAVFVGGFADTKMTLSDPVDGVYKALWEESDQLSILKAEDNSVLGTATLKSGAGQNTGVFVADVTIPDGTSVKLSFGKSAIEPVQTGEKNFNNTIAVSDPITVKAGSESAFTLQHKCAVAKINLTTSALAAYKLESVKLAGAGAEVTAQYATPAAFGEAKEVWLFADPVATATDFTVTVKVSDAGTATEIPVKFEGKTLPEGKVTEIKIENIVLPGPDVPTYGATIEGYGEVIVYSWDGEPEVKPVEGLPVGWNFYALYPGDTPADASAKAAASDFNYSWSFGQSNNDNDSRHPVGAAQPVSEHKVLATSGNAAAYLTGSGANVSAYIFNPSIQIKGFGEGDYFLMVIPVKNVTEAVKVTVEAGVGAAKAATGCWVLEYSSDASNWITAPGMKTVTRGEGSFECHWCNTVTSYTSATRKQYDKATDDTYAKYTFPLTGISAIADGNLYFRMRALKWNNDQTGLIENTGGWTDLKGFEVSLAE